MRPRVVEALNRWSGTGVFTYLVPNYFILLAVAFLAGTLFAVRRARRMGLDPDPVYGLALWGLPMALVGGRLAHVIQSPATYGGSILAVLDPLRGDSLAYGGFIGATVTIAAYLLLRRVEVWRYLDCAIPGVGVGNAITRAGCFLDGCDFGKVTGCWLGVAFPRGSLPFEAQVAQGLIPPAAPQSLPVHPVELYLVLKGLVLAAIAVRWADSSRAEPGEAFCLYWMAYAVARFSLEFLRGDADRGFVGPFSTSQAISIVVLLLAGAGFFLRWRQRPPGPGSLRRRRESG
jgi:phosphatidylglycerol:prolipoprotein diacylglycerol transferase